MKKLGLRRLDILFSKLIRLRAGYRCEFWQHADNDQKLHVSRCREYFREGNGLHASHFYGRRAMSTRFSLENVDCLCVAHHRYFEEHPAEYVIWKINKLGDDGFCRLRDKFNKPVKCTEAFKREMLVWLQDELKREKIA